MGNRNQMINSTRRGAVTHSFLMMAVAMLLVASLFGPLWSPVAAQDAGTPVAAPLDATQAPPTDTAAPVPTETATPAPSAMTTVAPTSQPTAQPTAAPKTIIAAVASQPILVAPAADTLPLAVSTSPARPVSAGTSVTVSAVPAISLTVAPTTIAAGGSAVGSATLTNTTAGAGGTVVYTVYSDSACTTTQTAPGSPSTVPVTNHIVPNSASITINLAGTAYWKAVYSGDGSNAGASSSCVPITVNKAAPTLAIGLLSTSITVGSTATGTATLTGSTTTAGGTVTYTVYSNNTCATTYTVTGSPSTVTVANAAVPNSVAITFNTAGTFYWKARYAGDANNTGPISSSCIALTVNKATPTIAIGLLSSSITVGSTATATATLSGATSTAGGTVTYTVYSNNTCTTTYTVTGSPSAKSVTNATVPNSVAITFNTAGTFYWKARYAGDANNTGPISSSCIALSVTPVSPSVGLSTTPSGSITTGDSATAQATLTGATTAAGGTVTYTVYTDNACTTTFSATGNPNTQTVTNHVAAASSSITFAVAPTTVYWKAVYSGDINNSGASSPCIALVINKATPSLTLTTAPASPPMKAGGTVKGQVTMTSAVSAGGSLTYTVYSDNACTTTFTATGSPSTVTVASNIVPDSALITIPTAGTVYWQAVYVGDAKNTAATSACVALIVAKAAPAASLSITPASPPMTVGGTATGAATLTGATSTASGTVVYTVYTDNACTTQVSPAQTSTQTAANAIVPNSSAFTFATTGTFYWNAVYNGDANNLGATSPCVSLVVAAKLSSSISLSLSPNPAAVGGSVTGSSTLTGTSASAGGTVTYTVYTDSSCTTAYSVTGSPSAVTVTNQIVPNSTAITFNMAGTFYWNAVYGGDAHNASATSSCVALTVNKATPTLSLAQSPAAVNAGSNFTVQFTLSAAAVNPTGTVTITRYSDNACSTALTSPSPATMTLSGGLVPDAPPVNYNFGGPAYQQANYSGDANNAAASTGCILVVVNPGPLTASVSSAAMTTVNYSNTAGSSTGQLIVSASDGRATWAGWNVTLISTNFAYGGTSPSGIAIPATGFTISSAPVVAFVSGQAIGSGGPSSGATGSLDQSRKIAAASSGYGSGAYQITAPVSLTIPSQSQAGTYTATVTVVIASGP